MTQIVAALFVDPRGVYADLPDVDLWDEERDARFYDGPYPVVAHPPCARWCRLAGFVESRWGYQRGEDGGCFGSALKSVRKFGGVLEHPAYSKAWDHFGLPEPDRNGGWTTNIGGGWSCYVEQGRYGHVAKKATWLYAVGIELPDLRWGFRGDGTGWHGFSWAGSKESRAAGIPRLPGHETERTPPEFRDALLEIARTALATELVA